MQRLGAPKHGSHGLHACTHYVVVRVLECTCTDTKIFFNGSIRAIFPQAVPPSIQFFSLGVCEVHGLFFHYTPMEKTSHELPENGASD